MHFFKKYSNIDKRCKFSAFYAEMSEWFKEHDWKSCDAGTYPEVQILFSAPTKNTLSQGVFFVELYEYRRGFEGGSRFARAKRFAVFKAQLRKRSRQRRQLIIVERGALLKAQILFSAPEY